MTLEYISGCQDCDETDISWLCIINNNIFSVIT